MDSAIAKIKDEVLAIRKTREAERLKQQQRARRISELAKAVRKQNTANSDKSKSAAADTGSATDSADGNAPGAAPDGSAKGDADEEVEDEDAAAHEAAMAAKAEEEQRKAVNMLSTSSRSFSIRRSCRADAVVVLVRRCRCSEAGPPHSTTSEKDQHAEENSPPACIGRFGRRCRCAPGSERCIRRCIEARGDVRPRPDV